MNGWVDGMDRHIRLDKRQTCIHTYVRIYVCTRQINRSYGIRTTCSSCVSFLWRQNLTMQSWLILYVSGFFLMLLLFLLFVFEAGS